MLGVTQNIHEQIDQELALVLFFLTVPDVFLDNGIMKMLPEPGISSANSLLIQRFQVFIDDGILEEGHGR